MTTDTKASSGAPEIDLKHFVRAAPHLVSMPGGFDTLIDAIANFKPKASLLGSMGNLDPTLLTRLDGMKADYEKLVEGPVKVLLVDNIVGTLPKGDLTPMYEFVEELLALLKAMELPVSLTMRRPCEDIRYSARTFAFELPELDDVAEPDPSLVTPDAFKELPLDEQKKILENAAELGYAVNSMGNDPNKVHKLMSKNEVGAMMRFLIDTAEDNSDPYDDVEIGSPKVCEIFAILSGKNPLAYRIETVINWQPQDIDIVGIHYVGIEGRILAQSSR